MARPISDEELQLKKRARRRLVGAIVLVTAIAVILPMVLDSEPKPVNQNVEIQIPPPDLGAFKPKSTPIRVAPDMAAADAPDAPAQNTAAPPAGIVDPTPAASAKVSSKADSSAAKLPTAVKAVKEAPKGTAKQSTGGAYAVQIEALADAAKAKQLEKKVASAGLQTYTEVVSTKGGEVTRVRAGPYDTREAAEKAREQLKAVGLAGKVVPK